MSTAQDAMILQSQRVAEHDVSSIGYFQEKILSSCYCTLAQNSPRPVECLQPTISYASS